MQGWPPDLDWITRDVAVGACLPEGRAAEAMRRHRVGAVIDVRREACDDLAELAACGARFLHLPTDDFCGVSQAMLDEGVAFAREAMSQRRRLLIHCQQGIGRSAVVALCVLVDRGLSPMEALTRAKDRRPQVSPSEAQYEAWAEWLRRRAPQAAVPSFHEFGCVAYRHLAAPA